MSYVVSVRRPASACALESSDFEALAQADPTLHLQGDVLVWADPTTSAVLRINVESDHLWTDEISGECPDPLLDKLRRIAAALNARVLGEEGEDLTDDSIGAVEALGVKQSIVGIAALLVAVVALPVFIAWFIIRAPWMLWKIARS